jgi:phage anti-repressor protein
MAAAARLKPFRVIIKGNNPLVRSRSGNKILSQKDIITALSELSKKQTLTNIQDPHGRFIISKQMSFKSDGKHIQRNYILDIKDKTGKIKKYFIKEEKLAPGIEKESIIPSYIWEDSINESKALEIISDYLKQHAATNTTTVKLMFAYQDKENNTSIICYNYQYGHHPKTLLQKGQIKINEFTEISRRLRILEDKVNNYLKQNHEKYDLSPETRITDIDVDNVFYDTKTKKLRIFNPILTT